MSQNLQRFSRIGRMIVALAAVCVMGLVVVTGLPPAVVQGAKDGWLERLAPDDQIDALERQLRGFDTAMAEVGSL
jgi:hypothetical protein